MLGLKRFPATRVVALPSALDSLKPPTGSIALRLAADELLIMPPAQVAVNDPHAIILPDGSFAGAWASASEAKRILERECEWELPRARPAFAQGAVAGIPVKLWLEEDRVFVVVQAPFVVEFEERIS